MVISLFYMLNPHSHSMVPPSQASFGSSRVRCCWLAGRRCFFGRAPWLLTLWRETLWTSWFRVLVSVAVATAAVGPRGQRQWGDSQVGRSKGDSTGKQGLSPNMEFPKPIFPPNNFEVMRGSIPWCQDIDWHWMALKGCPFLGKLIVHPK